MARPAPEWSGKKVRKAIDEAEAAFSECWNLLAAMKVGEPSGSLLDLQPSLATALQNLSKVSAKIAARKTDLVRRKERLSSVWFSQAMRRLATDQASVRGAVILGKSLGDAFAWFLYQNDAALLAEHSSHPKLALESGGVGGAAEFEMARNVQHFDDAFVLHHCLTTILRIGDVSLLRTSPLRVIGVGELKAGAERDGFLDVDMSLLLREPSSSITEARTAAAGPAGGPIAGLGGRHRARYERQMRRMEVALAAAAKRGVDVSHEATGSQYWGEFAEAAAGCQRGQFKATHLGGGLVVALHRSRRRALYDRLRDSAAEAAAAVTDEVAECILSAIQSGSPYNSVSIGSLQYGRGGHPTYQLGTMPLFWSPLPIELIRRIMFGELIALTLFNPAYLFTKLGEAGFTIASYNPPELSFRIGDGERVFTMMNAAYWVTLIPGRLFREEQVVALLLHLRDVLMKDPPANRGRIEFRFHEGLGPPELLDVAADVNVT